MSVYPHREGELDADKYSDLLFEILDASGVDYTWINAGTTGRITYNDDVERGLSVYTTVSEEHWGEIEEEVETTKEESNG